MNESRFVKRVLAERPNLANIGTYFYVRPVNHILSGFCCEMTPRGAYLWNFLYPLFDPSNTLHLTYSERIESPDGYIDFNNVEKNELPRIFIERIDSRMDRASEFLSVQNFCFYCERRPKLLEHEHVQMAFGFALVLLGEHGRALVYLNKAGEHLRDLYKRRCYEIIQLLSLNSAKAKKRIQDWEASASSRLNVQRVSAVGTQEHS